MQYDWVLSEPPGRAMPTTRRRLNLCPSDEAMAALDDLAAAIGKPRATIAAELLHEMADTVRGMAKMARLAKSGNKAGAKRALAHVVGDQLAQVLADTSPELFPRAKP